MCVRVFAVCVGAICLQSVCERFVSACVCLYLHLYLEWRFRPGDSREPMCDPALLHGSLGWEAVEAPQCRDVVDFCMSYYFAVCI